MPTSGMAVLGILSKNLIIFEENQSRLQGVAAGFFGWWVLGIKQGDSARLVDKILSSKGIMVKKCLKIKGKV